MRIVHCAKSKLTAVDVIRDRNFKEFKCFWIVLDFLARVDLYFVIHFIYLSVYPINVKKKVRLFFCSQKLF
jgi:hypothetical protein